MINSAITAEVRPLGRHWLGELFRFALLHMIEETARHAGHLDAMRQLIDGATGLPPGAALY